MIMLFQLGDFCIVYYISHWLKLGGTLLEESDVSYFHAPIRMKDMLILASSLPSQFKQNHSFPANSASSKHKK